jgi:RNA recognition motif-containing protein
LRTFFETFGHIREAKVIRGNEGCSKGYGFVTFDTEEEAQAVRNLVSCDFFVFSGTFWNFFVKYQSYGCVTLNTVKPN